MTTIRSMASATTILTSSRSPSSRWFILLIPLMSFILFSVVLPQRVVQAVTSAPRAEDLRSVRSINLMAGDITTDTIWTSAGSPYTITTGVTVLAGATLTVEPGVEVRFAANTALTVRGRLLANGTSGQPVTFTGITKTPGSWRGLIVQGTAGALNTGSSLNYVTVEYGGLAASTGASLYVEYATLTVDHSLFRNSANHGLYGGQKGLANISDSSFVDNVGYAILFNDLSADPALKNLAASGNGTDAVGLNPGFSAGPFGAHIWESSGLPYVVNGIPNVSITSTLTISPAVQVRFLPNSGLTVRGKIMAIGAAEQPITFTGSTATPGSWRGITVQGLPGDLNTGSVFSNVTIEYGGQSNGDFGNLSLNSAVVTVTHSLFRFGGKHGLVGSNQGFAQISDSSFIDNAAYAMYLIDGSVNPVLGKLTATGNGVNAVGINGYPYLRGAHVWEATGIPYVVDGAQVLVGSSLTVEPGVEAQFGNSTELTIGGVLKAIGTATSPITFTGVTKTPGSWRGVSVKGSLLYPATVLMRHVTVAYGGGSPNSANVTVSNGQVALYRSVIRDGAADGVIVGLNGSGSVVELSQITGNAGYGVRNTDIRPTRVVLASNNWWGAASGPTADTTCNPGGAGSRVSGNVAFKPFLSSPTADPGPVAASEARILSLTPSRWFAPADGISQVWIKITLRDGTGRPLPGRQVRLQTTRGSATDGGVTDVQGQSYATLTSLTAGDAEIAAQLDLQSTCEFARSPLETIAFTPPNAGTDLLPNAAAPYMNGQIEASPMPIVRGISTTLSARLNNPNSFPISVDATFGVFQLGIGLTFGPVGQVQGVIIPANSQSVIQVPWTPAVSGHTCIELRYTWQPLAMTNAGLSRSMDKAQSGGGGRSLRNFSVSSGPTAGPNEKPILAKAQTATGVVGKLGADKGALFIPKLMVQAMLGMWFNNAGSIFKNLGGDPPRQDYRIIAQPIKPIVPPVQPDGQLSTARAAALNSLIDALLDVQANGDAATISLDRYGGAAAASDQLWASQQAKALSYYKQKMGAALIVSADRLDDFLQVLQNEGVADVTVTVDDLRVYQDRLRTQGFSADEILAGQLLGLSNDEIEAIRQERIAADPAAEAGNLMDYLTNASATFRQLGNVLTTPSDAVGNRPTVLSSVAAVPNATDLLRIYEGVVVPVQVGNPFTQTVAIDLRARRVDLPPDWMVSVTPISVTLAPGSQTTVTVSIYAGTAAVQNTQPRVAVEGYANGQLLDGVTLDVFVPDVKYRVYMPLILR